MQFRPAIESLQEPVVLTVRSPVRKLYPEHIDPKAALTYLPSAFES